MSKFQEERIQLLRNVIRDNVQIKNETMTEALDEIERLQVNVQALRSLLMVVLDAVDYTAGNCRPNEMVGAVLSQEVIKLVKQEAK